MDNPATKTGQMLTLEAKKMQSSTVCIAVECLSSFQIPFFSLILVLQYCLT